MKNRILILFLFAATVSASAQTATNPATYTQAGSEITLKETSFDFGKIAQGRPVYHVFEVVNSGKDPLKLENVQTSCGCTTPEWSPEPIAPGASASIKVGYNAAAEGAFSKSITIVYNGNQTKTLLITGNVYKGPATSAPLNPSITLLRQKN